MGFISCLTKKAELADFRIVSGELRRVGYLVLEHGHDVIPDCDERKLPVPRSLGCEHVEVFELQRDNAATDFHLVAIKARKVQFVRL